MKQDEIKKIVINNETYIRESDASTPEPDELNGLKYAIIRSRDQGVMAGYVVSIEGRVVTLKRARHLWRWSSRFVLTDLAEYGVNNTDDCRFSCEASQDTVMLEACGVMYCTYSAGASIRGVEAENND